MNTVTGNDILAYQGNVGLGLNSEGIVEYGDTDAKLLNESLFNLAYMNMQKNKNIYDQKIKDRDDTFKMIASGQLQLDQVLPEDRPKLMDMLNNVKQIYFEKNGDVKSDPNAYLKFQDAMAKFNEANVYAKHRFIEVGKQEADAAKEVDPDIQKKKFAHIGDQRKQDLYKDVLPYQQSLDYKPEDIFKELPVSQGATYRDGDYEVTPFMTDLNGSRDLFLNDFNFNKDKPQGRRMQLFEQQWLGNKTNPLDQPRPIEVVKQDMDRVNKKLEQIRNMLPENDPRRNLLTPIEIVEDANGNRSSNNTTPDLVWKINLATQFANGDNRKLNKDLSAIDLTKAKIGTEKADQLLKDRQGKAALTNAEANKIEANAKAAKTWEEIRGLKDDRERKKAEGDFINTQALQMFDVNRFENGQNLIGNVSDEQIGYLQKGVEKLIGGKKTIQKDDITSAVYDYSNTREPKIKVTLKGGKSYTVRPTDVRLGVIKSVYGESAAGKEGEYIANVETNFMTRNNGNRDFNANAIDVWKKERGKVTVEMLDENGNPTGQEMEFDGNTAQQLVNAPDAKHSNGKPKARIKR